MTRPDPEVEELQQKIQDRKKKISNVRYKQKQNKVLLKRWNTQNERDLKKIEALKNERTG